jgi:hypothetical protein
MDGKIEESQLKGSTDMNVPVAQNTPSQRRKNCSEDTRYLPHAPAVD